MESPTGITEPIDLDKSIEQELFNLDHEANSSAEQLRVVLKIRRNERFPKDIPEASFTVKQGDKILGETNGHLQKSKVDNLLEFLTFQTDNFTKTKADPTKMDLPRLMGKTISELVARGYIGRWYSSDFLSPSAHSLYGKYLAADPRLEVAPQSPKSAYRYLVTAKTS